MGNRGIRQTVIQNINSAGPGGGNTGRALYAASQRTSNINYFTPFNTSSYNSLQLQATRRIKGAMIGVSYTLSRAVDYADDQDSGLTFNWVPMLQRNKAVAGFDRTHNLQIYGNYDLPFGKGKRWAQSGFVSKLAGGWQTNWILSRTSGLPFSVVTSGTSSECARQHPDCRPGPDGRPNSRRPRLRSTVFRSQRVRTGHRRSFRQRRPRYSSWARNF